MEQIYYTTDNEDRSVYYYIVGNYYKIIDTLSALSFEKELKTKAFYTSDFPSDKKKLVNFGFEEEALCGYNIEDKIFIKCPRPGHPDELLSHVEAYKVPGLTPDSDPKLVGTIDGFTGKCLVLKYTKTRTLSDWIGAGLSEETASLCIQVVDQVVSTTMDGRIIKDIGNPCNWLVDASSCIEGRLYVRPIALKLSTSYLGKKLEIVDLFSLIFNLRRSDNGDYTGTLEHVNQLSEEATGHEKKALKDLKRIIEEYIY